MSVNYRCTKCGKTFALTVADAAQMRRSKGEIVCPDCGAPGAEKQDVSVVVSGEDSAAENSSSVSGDPSKPQVTISRTP